MRRHLATRLTFLLTTVAFLAGAPRLSAQNKLYTFNGDAAGDMLGFPVAGAGDVNKDGYLDFVVGAPQLFSPGPGSARVLSGADGAILYTFYGDSVGDTFGGSVAGAGDVNKDGYADVIVGAPNNGTGFARVLSGADGTILYTFYGDSVGDTFGQSVVGAGDVNKDGYADIIVGAYGDDDNGAESGSARVFSGLGCCPSTGLSCTSAPCESCPAMVATTTGGAPTLGNNSFALELVNAPSNMTYAVLALSSNPCAEVGYSYVFCDTVKAPEPWWFLAAMPFTPGVSTCTTNVQVSAPIPNNAVFLGMALGVQWATSCDASVLGTSISNCVSFVVTDT